MKPCRNCGNIGGNIGCDTCGKPLRERKASCPSDAADGSAVVGYWTRVADSMPDDEITVLVWDESLGDATLAHHDTEIKARRGDSGWIMAGTSRVLLGVTLWCQQINPPNAGAVAPPESATPPKK